MGAGNWLSSAGLGDVNVALLPKAIEVAMHESAKNMAPFAHPVIQGILAKDEGLSDMLGGLGIQVGLGAIGQGKMASTAEGTAVAATNFSLTTATLTPARREFARVTSDYARSLNEGLLRGEISPDAYALLVYEGYRVWGNTLIDLIVALATSATNVVGTTGTDLVWATLANMVTDFKNRGASGSLIGFISAKGAKDLSGDATSLGGAVQMSAQVQQLISNGAQGAYIGRFFGSLDLFLSSELDAIAADTAGLAFSAEGVHTKHVPVPLPREAEVLVNAGMYSMELRRTGGSVTRSNVVTYNGVGIREQGGIAQILYVTA